MVGGETVEVQVAVEAEVGVTVQGNDDVIAHHVAAAEVQVEADATALRGRLHGAGIVLIGTQDLALHEATQALVPREDKEIHAAGLRSALDLTQGNVIVIDETILTRHLQVLFDLLLNLRILLRHRLRHRVNISICPFHRHSMANSKFRLGQMACHSCLHDLQAIQAPGRHLHHLYREAPHLVSTRRWFHSHLILDLCLDRPKVKVWDSKWVDHRRPEDTKVNGEEDHRWVIKVVEAGMVDTEGGVETGSSEEEEEGGSTYVRASMIATASQPGFDAQ